MACWYRYKKKYRESCNIKPSMIFTYNILSCIFIPFSLLVHWLAGKLEKEDKDIHLSNHISGFSLAFLIFANMITIMSPFIWYRSF